MQLQCRRTAGYGSDHTKNLIKVKHSFMVGKFRVVSCQGDCFPLWGFQPEIDHPGRQFGFADQCPPAMDWTILNFAGPAAMIQLRTALPLDGDMLNPEALVKFPAGLFD